MNILYFTGVSTICLYSKILTFILPYAIIVKKQERKSVKMGKIVNNHQKNSSTQSFHTEREEHNDYNFPNNSKNIGDYNLSQSSPTVKHILVSKRLKDLRIKRNLSQPQLAQRIGVTKQSISRWERSDSTVSILRKNLEKLANALACTPDYLQGKTEKTNYFITDEGKEEGFFGMPLNLRPLINERISSYSDEQLKFLYEFLFSFETYTSSQLELFQRIVFVIAATAVPKITAYHPLGSWESFNMIFRKTKEAIQQIREELNRKELPANIKLSLDSLDHSILENYNTLSYCLQSEKNFRNSLHCITDSFTHFINSLSEPGSTKEQLNYIQEAYLDRLNKSLDSDISDLFHNLK